MKRILLVYCNLFMEPLLPLGIGYLSSSLKQDGYKVKVFDTTLYNIFYNDDQEDRIGSNQVKPVDWKSIGIETKKTDIVDDFKKLIKDFEPNIIGFSVVENSYPIASYLIKNSIDIINNKIIIFGGIFATFGYDYIVDDLSNTNIDFKICRGEGENFIQCNTSKLCDLNKLPVPDFTGFEKNRIYRPMDGKLYRMLPVEISRGCPFKCSYCSAPAYTNEFKGWYRIKEVKKIIYDIVEYVINYDIEYIYFVSETFLATENYWKELFYRSYSKITIPFWMNTRPETVNERDIRSLAEIGCHRISMGLEGGNESFRRKVLNRNYSNERLINAAKIIKKYGIQLSINNIIGFPDETEEMILETIEVNKRIEADSYTVSVFQPYRGTKLHKICVDKGYFPKDDICIGKFSESLLTMPRLSKDQIKYYYFNFNKLI